MKNLITAAVSRPVGVICALLVLGIACALSLSILPLESLPDIDIPRVIVETKYDGMSAGDIRRIVTIPLEDALAPAKGLERMQSVSRDGSSIIELDFRWGTKSAAAAVLVREMVDAVYPALPEGVDKPAVTQGGSEREIHAIIAVDAPGQGPAFERELADFEIRARIRRIEGAGEVTLLGGTEEEAVVNLNVPSMLRRGYTAQGFARMLAEDTGDIPAGNAREGGLELVVVSEGRPRSLNELSTLVLGGLGGGAPLYLADIAQVRTESVKQKSVFLYDGREMTALFVYRRPGADPVRLSRALAKLTAEEQERFERDARIYLVYDAAPSIIKGLSSLALSALCGAVSVTAVLVLFIKRLDLSALAALSIPVSTAGAFSVLALTGRSLNGMSLSGIALGIGLVSDTAVVILDALYRRFADNRRGAAAVSYAYSASIPSVAERAAAATAAASVAASSFGGTATTAVVFVPVLFLPGALGALFGDMAVSIVASVTTGWLYAQFALPALFRITFKVRPAGVSRVRTPVTAPTAPFAQGFKKLYAKKLRDAIQRPYRTLGAALFCSMLGALLLMARPVSLVSEDAATEVEAALVFPAGTLLAEAAREAQNAAALIAALTEVKTVFGWAGAEDEDVKRRASTGYRPETFVFRALLTARAEPEAARDAVRRALDEIPAHIAVHVDFPSGQKEKILGLAEAASIAVTGKTAAEAHDKAKTLLDTVRQDDTGTVLGARLRPDGGRPRLRIMPRREAMAHLGLRGADLAEAALMATEGALAAQLEIDGRPLDVRVRGGGGGRGAGESGGTRQTRSPAQALRTVPVGISGGSNGGAGTPVFLGETSIIREEYAEAALVRLDRADTVYVDVAVKKGGAAFWRGLEARQFTRLEGFSRSGESVFAKYRGTLWLTVALVALLLYVTMGAQFESFKMPLILMMAIPFSLAGAGPALFLSGSGLDLGAVIGIITLFGISVNNGMVLYETALSGIASGLPVKKAVYLGALSRLSPVLATTLTTAIALIPVAFSRTGERAMAQAMLGGVLASASLCLFALPPLFAPLLAQTLLKKTGSGSDNQHEGMDARQDGSQNTGNGMKAAAHIIQGG